MAKNDNPAEKPRRFEHIFEDDHHTTIWKYDLDKFTNGPISVEIKPKYELVKPKKKKKDKEHFNRWFA